MRAGRGAASRLLTVGVIPPGADAVTCPDSKADAGIGCADAFPVLDTAAEGDRAADEAAVAGPCTARAAPATVAIAAPTVSSPRILIYVLPDSPKSPMRSGRNPPIDELSAQRPLSDPIIGIALFMQLAVGLTTAVSEERPAPVCLDVLAQRVGRHGERREAAQESPI